MLDLVAVVAEVLASSTDADPRVLATAVLDRLTHTDVSVDLHEAFHAAELSARSAYAERDDLYADPRNSTVATQIAIAALHGRLRSAIRSTEPVSLADAKRIASLASYRDWRFAVAVAGGGLGVTVEATNTDVHDPDRSFTTTRFAIVTSTVEEACFRAAVAVEVHEAQERFRVDGRAVFDPHSAETVPAPTNLRRRADERVGRLRSDRR